MKSKTINDLLKQFHENLDVYDTLVLADEEDGWDSYKMAREQIANDFAQSIKDALEAVRVEKKELKDIDGSDQSKWGEFYRSKAEMRLELINSNTTQYDENCKKFLGEK